MIEHVCSLVGSLFVHDVRCDLSKTEPPIFMKFDTAIHHLSQISLLTFQRSRSKFKVKTAVLKLIHL